MPTAIPSPTSIRQTLTVTNTSRSAITGPILVLLANLTQGVTMVNNTGTLVKLIPDVTMTGVVDYLANLVAYTIRTTQFFAGRIPNTSEDHVNCLTRNAILCSVL
jgi:hypothetical protein